MRIALRRLNDAKLDPDYANKAIHLRICIENIFLSPGERDRISSKVKKRMPTMTTFSKKRSEKIYGLLSSAVHSGKPFSHEQIEERAIIKELSGVLKKILENGSYPSWDAGEQNFLAKLFRKSSNS